MMSSTEIGTPSSHPMKYGILNLLEQLQSRTVELELLSLGSRTGGACAGSCAAAPFRGAHSRPELLCSAAVSFAVCQVAADDPPDLRICMEKEFGQMTMSKLLASTAVAALLSLGMSALPATMASADVTATSVVGQPEELIGKDVVDEQGKDVGDIDSVLIDKDGQVKYVIVGVGGFLGIGEQNVALRWDLLRLTEDGKEVIAPVTKELLSQLPPHRYPDAANSGKVYSLDEDLALNPYLATDGKTDATIAAAADSIDTKTLIDKEIINANGDKVGKVESVIIDKGGEVQYVVAGVGGFLGIGEKHVAMKWDDLTIAENGERVLANVTKEQLQALPDYKLPENTTFGTVALL